MDEYRGKWLVMYEQTVIEGGSIPMVYEGLTYAEVLDIAEKQSREMGYSAGNYEVFADTMFINTINGRQLYTWPMIID